MNMYAKKMKMYKNKCKNNGQEDGLGTRGALPPWGTPGAPGGEGLDGCKDSESSY